MSEASRLPPVGGELTAINSSLPGSFISTAWTAAIPSLFFYAKKGELRGPESKNKKQKNKKNIKINSRKKKLQNWKISKSCLLVHTDSWTHPFLSFYSPSPSLFLSPSLLCGFFCLCSPPSYFVYAGRTSKRRSARGFVPCLR